MAKGGLRPGAGRKRKVDEMHVRNLATSAIEATYGSLQNGFQALLKSNEASLIKFVFEHAAGKPKDTLDIDAKVDGNNQVIYIGKKKK